MGRERGGDEGVRGREQLAKAPFPHEQKIVQEVQNALLAKVVLQEKLLKTIN